LALLFLLAPARCVGQQPDITAPDVPPPDTAHPTTNDTRSPRALFKLFGIDEQFWSGFVDDAPLVESEREKLLRVLFRLRQLSPAALENAPLAEIPFTEDRVAESRGEVVLLAGQAKRVVREELDPALRERLELEAYYRCEIVTDDGLKAVVYALSVPSDWKLDEPLDERCSVRGVFIKRLAPPPAVAGNDPTCLFAARRVAWYPHNVLGDLGMDFGLFDEVRDRTKLTERECFYQMLAGVRRASEQEIDAQARDNIASFRKDLAEKTSSSHLDPRQQFAMRRALARAQRGVSDVVPLFNEPAQQRGKLFVLRGEALRAIEVRVEDPDIVDRFGIDHYYEVEIFTEDSQNHPLVCCVAELPPDMPRGDNIHEKVSICGFFLKSWAYGAQPRASDAEAKPGAPARQLSAPLLIAKTLEWTPASVGSAHGANAAIALAAAIVASIVVLWYVARGVRRAPRSAGQARESLPERISLDTLGISPDDEAQSRA
jgi:hypothetical protein